MAQTKFYINASSIDSLNFVPKFGDILKVQLAGHTYILRLNNETINQYSKTLSTTGSTDVTLYFAYYRTKYHVFYTGTDNEVSYDVTLGVSYTRPKVRPLQWRTKTTTAGVTTYGDWVLYSSRKPTAGWVEDTNYEYMKESYIEKEVLTGPAFRAELAVSAHSSAGAVNPFIIEKIGEISDQIHDDIIKLDCPEIEDNITVHKHKDNETVGGAAEYRRIART